MTRCRYVVLHHTGWIEDHFDLLLDIAEDQPLLAWRLDAFPNPAIVTPLPAHRRFYLDYEGPVSNNRGEVKRVTSGKCEIVACTASDWQICRLSDGVELRLPPRGGKQTEGER